MSSTRRPEKQGRPAALLGQKVDRFGAESAWIARYRITLIQAARRWVSVSRTLGRAQAWASGRWRRAFTDKELQR